MAKDSDKRSVLNRRKQELDHALRHGFPPAAVEVRVEKLRAAAIAVLKKNSGPFALVEDGPGNAAWKALRARWEALSVDEIVALTAEWGSQPTVRGIRFGDSS